MATVAQMLLWAGKELESTSETPMLDARVILAHVIGKDSIYVMTERDVVLPRAHEWVYREAIERRKKGTPIAYITGMKEFMGMDFRVSESVLIPRADTEVLVEKSIEILRDRKEAKVLDLCCGSGAIGLSIAKFVGGSHVVLADISQEAIGVSKENAFMLGLEGRAEFVVSDLFEGVSGSFDLIASNPPYISGEDMEKLPKDVADFEPHGALYGGEDGLDFYRKITENAISHLNRGGVLIFEIGYDQGDEVMDIMKRNGFKGIQLFRDLSGRPRVVFGELVPET
ncbi:peptide chain release factor N(5)-glutamine methyltransferase [Youngiibacter multivorans]|uniref:Release factor glutamine methyltransferase n=1 Tax=Youngiibacter multivorans TaxID=937251 RepID=A0ABS4G7Z0_9CLOT|nr:peptide chain release factor N(5)-glutamine methyltransferase [Youngiibacter multivorans]MBP1920537.1 release factor glutamine methyltransferase [Youngiibacter multivorans]